MNLTGWQITKDIKLCAFSGCQISFTVGNNVHSFMLCNKNGE